MSDTPPANPPDDPAQLRKKLDDALKLNREKDDRIRQQNTMLMLHDAQLGHLNEYQRTALVASLPKDGEVTPDSLKTMATNLGFPSAPTPSAPPANPPAGDQNPPAGDPNQPTPPADPNQPDLGQGIPPTYDPGTNYLSPAPGSQHPDPRVQQSIQGLTQMEHAHIMALRGGQDGGTFDQKMKEAKSKEETLAVIRQQGGNAGLILESDLD